MSQFPSPYTPPSFSVPYEAAPQNLLAAPRRAGTLMLVVGSLVLLMGACNAITALVVPAQELLQRQRAFLTASQPVLLPAERMRHWTVTVGAATVGIGVALLILGVAVRGGSRGATAAALAITSLLLLICGIATLVFLLGGLAEPALMPLACLPGAPLLLMGWQLAWLITANRSTAALAEARQRSSAQYGQYQQNLSAYSSPPAAGGYGDPSTVPPPPANGPQSPGA